MLMTIFALYIGIGVGITVMREEWYDVEDFIMETIAWPFVIIEPLGDMLTDLIDAVFDQFDDVLEWFSDLFDRDDTSTYYRSDGDMNVNIQANGDIKVNGENIQTRGRSQRKNKKSAEVIDLQKNPLE